jgi:hypothetical protein
MAASAAVEVEPRAEATAGLVRHRSGDGINLLKSVARCGKKLLLTSPETDKRTTRTRGAAPRTRIDRLRSTMWRTKIQSSDTLCHRSLR